MTAKGQWVHVVSSRIARMHYDQKTLTLTVQFTRGRVYEYSPVSPFTYADVMQADSIGAAFGKQVETDPQITCAEISLAD